MATSEHTSIDTRCKDKIIRLHLFFQEWFTASVPNNDETFDAFNSSISTEFLLISPRGVVDAKPELAASLRRAYGIQKDSKFTIEIKNCKLLYIGKDESCLMSYEEWQKTEMNDGDDVETARLSTVLFRQQPNCFNGLEWVHVYETWLPDMGPKIMNNKIAAKVELQLQF